MKSKVRGLRKIVAHYFILSYISESDIDRASVKLALSNRLKISLKFLG